MDNLFMKGELLQLQTKDSNTIKGRFYSMTKDKSQISLYDVKDSTTKEPYEGVIHFYDAEIQNIEKIKEKNNDKHLKISQKELEVIIKISKKYTWINQVDNTFHEAIDDLKQYNFVGLSTDGANMGRKCKMPVLVLSTPQQIYIFDIKVMQYHAFEAGLRKILESETPKKIVHDCRKLSDCLYHKHNVKLTSVFDTQVADLIITKNKHGGLPNTVKTLSECLFTYLGLQPSIIEEKLDMMQCSERPLPATMKEILAKNIAYLHRLSEVVHDEMMLPYRRGVECFVESLRSCDDFKAWETCGKYNQLPKNFKSAIEY